MLRGGRDAASLQLAEEAQAQGTGARFAGGDEERAECSPQPVSPNGSQNWPSLLARLFRASGK